MAPGTLFVLAPILLAQAPASVDYAALQKEVEQASAAIRTARNRKATKSELQSVTEKALEPLRALQKGAAGEALEAGLIAELAVVPYHPGLASRILREVPPGSRAWRLAPGRLLENLPDLFEEQGASYVARLEKEGIPEVRMAITKGKIRSFVDREEYDEAKSRLAKYQAEFPQNKDAAQLGTEIKSAMERSAITGVGAQAPDFSIQDLDDPKVVYTPASFKGKHLMLDFWASWCGPCCGEIPGAQSAYAKFKGKGFEILSISADQKPDDVRTFRSKPGTPMPWKHAFGGERNSKSGIDHAINKAYMINAWPTLLLLGPDGRIVAKGDDLRGEKLERTLAKFLDRK